MSKHKTWWCWALGLVCTCASAQTTRPDRAAWMAEARWGVMTHYLADWIARRENAGPMTVDRWNDLVDRFDVEALAKQIESVGARYHIMTIGQNSGYYCSPNGEYDRIVGITPSKCSRRDLIADLSAAMSKRGIRLIVYLPAGAPSGDQIARQKLQWQPGPHPNREFQTHWESIIREWSTRWGANVHGWWFDGCYWPNTMYRADTPPNFGSFAAAARAGNPNSAVAFNPGVVYRTISITPHEDIIAGEIDLPEKQSIKRTFDGFVDGTRLHMLSYLGQRWGNGTPRFTAEQILAYTRPTIEAGGFVTWDVPIQSNGTISNEFLEQLEAVGKAARDATTRPTTQSSQRQQ
jgi:alpha-L-fucosidase